MTNPTIDYKVPDGEAQKSKEPFSFEGETFTLEDDGVFLIPQDKNKPPKKVCSWLKVAARTIDEKSNEEGFIVNFRNGSGKLRELNFSRSKLAANSSTLNEELEGQGLQIFSEGSKRNFSALVRYLKAVIYDGKIPERRVIPRAGWASEDYKTFLFSNRCISIEDESERPLLSKEAPPMLSESKGTLEEWKASISKISDYSARLRFALSVSLASVLVSVVKGNNRLFNFVGQSGSGKSTILHSAWSVWGRARNIYTFKASKNGLEEIFSERNDVLFAGDEVKQLTAEGIYDLAFNYAEGQGKARSDMGRKAQEIKEWRGYALTASEEDLQTMKAAKQKRGMPTTLEGEAVRFLQIPAAAGPWGVFDCFPQELMPQEFDGTHQHEEDEEQTKDGIPAALREKQNFYVTSAVNALNETAYGTAGPAFIEQIEHDIKGKGLETFKKDLEDCMALFKERINAEFNAGERSQVRVLQAFALVAAAGELAISYGVLPYEKGKALEDAATIFQAWTASEGTAEQQAEIAVEMVRNASESSRGFRRYQWEIGGGFQTKDDGIGSVIEGTVIEYDGDKPLCVIYQPRQFTKVVKNTGVERERLIRELLKREMLFKPNGDKAHYGQRQLRKDIPKIGIFKSWYFILLNGIYPEDTSKAEREKIIDAVSRLLQIDR